MKSNLYLYNTDEVPEIDSYTVIRRLELLEEHLTELLNPHYSERDYKRIRDVQSAISFWNNINKGNK